MPGSSADLHQPPVVDEIEVSLFGPGVGESAVVHLGGGDWIIVDSCVERTTGRPIALRYLEDLGVDVAKAIKLIVVTHWHDDHINGVAAILRAAQSARIACSAALRSEEFYKLIAASERAMMVSPGSAEFSAIFEILTKRAAPGVRPESVGPDWVQANRRLWQRQGSGPCPVDIFSLSPSAASMTLAFREFAQMLPQEGTTKRRLIAQTPNEVAVVLWIEAGDIRILLGADLENTCNPDTGWQAIVTSDARPTGLAHVFKVPHHGSANADHPDVWVTMLVINPHAVLTAFSRGHPLPTAADIERLKGRTPNAYCTTRATRADGGWAPPRRDAAVERTLKEVIRTRKALTGPMGHIRLRARHFTPDSIQVDLFNGAYRL